MIRFTSHLKNFSGGIRTNSSTLRAFSSSSDDHKDKPKRKQTSSSGSSSSSSEDEQKKHKSADVRKKLNLLLSDMLENRSTTSSDMPKLDLAKAKNHKEIGKQAKEALAKESEAFEKKISDAALNVAETLNDDKMKVQSELLQKLLNRDNKSESVASLSDIFKDMTIDREVKHTEVSRAQQVHRLLNFTDNSKTNVKKSGRSSRPVQKRPVTAYSESDHVDLFGGERLGIFPEKKEIASWPEREINKTFKKLHENELKVAVTHPPSNYFQQMILWTEQGKIWQFPIDNEQGLSAEKNVSFAEHIFLEKHLESWCPPKGPIRHFMELVCVGLSKNYYLSVESKKEHIEWYKNYFAEKQVLLHETGAIPAGFEINKSKIIAEK